ncbi:prolipoprotein diacylglyceryl transferase [Bacteriovorax sp. Seq25_V]|uniref:prolipoprotein diacylglyceryl transferase n=1 Tax=Bacteriovorax sp. Seq25_V TaxID=1201288 RepID=UPI00038A3D45|nr:prolipoprotein diacylglyceryl transferase [Bacteriovorax sp. Seq25_V]EQC45523.1 prolipoprotein diacylglyceryl transferase [Bacteriovorax sp. Seq25_V]
MSYYVHNLSPIAFHLFGMPFAWYWLVYFCGYFWVLYSLKLIKQESHQISAVDFQNYLFIGFFSMLLGGKFFYILFYNLSYYVEEPSRIFKIWEGGMSFHGAIIGSCAWTFIYAKIKKISFWKLTDLVVTSVPLVLLFGRLANFINGELAGRISTLPWAVVFPRYADGLARHPSQIYEAMLEGAVLFMIMWRGRKFLSEAGRQSVRFLFFYGLFRFICEFFRAPDIQIGYIAGLTIGQFYCLAMMLIAFVIFTRSRT